MNVRIQFTTANSPDDLGRPARARFLGHPFFAWAGLRPLQAQHTAREHVALMKHAKGRASVVEIGVAEGTSAIALCEAMGSSSTLYLVDPYHLSRIPQLNFMRRAAHRAIARTAHGRVIWLETFSQRAVLDWKGSIDFLLIDGDHREQAVETDWTGWKTFLDRNGVAAFHDARLFANGWTSPEDGPVRFINRTFRSASGSEWIIFDEVDSLVFVCRREYARSFSRHPQGPSTKGQQPIAPGEGKSLRCGS